MLKRILLKLLNVLSVVIILCSISVLLTVVLTKKGDVPNIMGYSLFRVMTGSMEPNIPTNSLIVVKRLQPSELREGDVISFYSRDPALRGEVNTHRIIEIRQEAGKYYFATKGDANNVEDKYITQQEDLIGKVIFSSVKLGKFVRLLSNPLVFVPLIIVPLVVLLGQSLWESVTLARIIARDEEEAAVREAVEAIRKKRAAESGETEKETELEGKAGTKSAIGFESPVGAEGTDTNSDGIDSMIGTDGADQGIIIMDTTVPRELEVVSAEVNEVKIKTAEWK